MLAMHQTTRPSCFCGLGNRNPGEVLSQPEISRRVGKTENAIKKEAFRLRQRYGQFARAEIAQAQIREPTK